MKKRVSPFLVDVPKNGAELATIFGTNGGSIVFTVLRVTCDSIGVKQHVSRHDSLNLPASEYVSGYIVPN